MKRRDIQLGAFLVVAAVVYSYVGFLANSSASRWSGIVLLALTIVAIPLLTSLVQLIFPIKDQDRGKSLGRSIDPVLDRIRRDEASHELAELSQLRNSLVRATLGEPLESSATIYWRDLAADSLDLGEALKLEPAHAGTVAARIITTAVDNARRSNVLGGVVVNVERRNDALSITVTDATEPLPWSHVNRVFGTFRSAPRQLRVRLYSEDTEARVICLEGLDVNRRWFGGVRDLELEAELDFEIHGLHAQP